MTDLRFALPKENYGAIRLLAWGVCRGHIKEASKGSFGNRLVHALIATTQILPIIGHIAALFEKVIVSCYRPATSTSTNLTGKRVEHLDISGHNEGGKAPATAVGSQGGRDDAALPHSDGAAAPAPADSGSQPAALPAEGADRPLATSPVSRDGDTGDAVPAPALQNTATAMPLGSPHDGAPTAALTDIGQQPLAIASEGSNGTHAAEREGDDAPAAQALQQGAATLIASTHTGELAAASGEGARDDAASAPAPALQQTTPGASSPLPHSDVVAAPAPADTGSQPASLPTQGADTPLVTSLVSGMVGDSTRPGSPRTVTTSLSAPSHDGEGQPSSSFLASIASPVIVGEGVSTSSAGTLESLSPSSHHRGSSSPIGFRSAVSPMNGDRVRGRQNGTMTSLLPGALIVEEGARSPSRASMSPPRISPNRGIYSPLVSSLSAASDGASDFEGEDSSGRLVPTDSPRSPLPSHLTEERTAASSPATSLRGEDVVGTAGDGEGGVNEDDLILSLKVIHENPVSTGTPIRMPPRKSRSLERPSLRDTAARVHRAGSLGPAKPITLRNAIASRLYGQSLAGSMTRAEPPTLSPRRRSIEVASISSAAATAVASSRRPADPSMRASIARLRAREITYRNRLAGTVVRPSLSFAAETHVVDDTPIPRPPLSAGAPAAAGAGLASVPVRVGRAAAVAPSQGKICRQVVAVKLHGLGSLPLHSSITPSHGAAHPPPPPPPPPLVPIVTQLELLASRRELMARILRGMNGK